MLVPCLGSRCDAPMNVENHMKRRSQESIRNVGIVAHIDSGKTTLTERILRYTGRLTTMHEVRGKDGVGATMDFMPLEREKGITIQSAATFVQWRDCDINVIDTPGHVDFTIEVERALRVLDGAIIVLCAVGGVQSQTLTIDRQMRRYGVPSVAFVNKCDRVGADPLRVCQQMRDELGHNAVMIQLPLGLERHHQGVIDLVEMCAYLFEGEDGEDVTRIPIPDDVLDVAARQHQILVEALADVDDTVAELYLSEQEIPKEVLIAALAQATRHHRMTPVCVGSAYKNKGIQPLLDAVCNLLPAPHHVTNVALDQNNDEAEVVLSSEPDDPLVMLAFKLEASRYGQWTYCRLYQGSLNKGDTVYNTTHKTTHKVGRMARMHANQIEVVTSAQAGDIVSLFGAPCATGQTFTDGKEHNYSMTSMYVPEPVMTLAVAVENPERRTQFSNALQRFSQEDPTFRVSTDEETGETLLGGMGELHLDVYIERIRREYEVEVEVSEPQVAYRETITRRAPFDHLLRKCRGGIGQYAGVVGYIEPSEDGESYEFRNETSGGSIPKEFIPSCDKGFQRAMQKGSLGGYPVVGVTVCVNDGRYHSVDSSDLAFQIAAVEAFRNVYMDAAPVLLEPRMKVSVETPEEFLGAISGTLSRRRGNLVHCGSFQGKATLEADVPLAEMFGYARELRSVSQGKAEFAMEFKRYDRVPEAVQREVLEAKDQ